jgi:hypothetical protein
MSTPQKRWLMGGGLLFFLLFICALPSAICIYLVKQLPLTSEERAQARLDDANRLDYVLGEVEPVLLAGDDWSFPNLSPDGKWLAVTKPVRRDGSREWGIMDMETYHIYPLDISGPSGDAIWVDNHHFRPLPVMVRVPEMNTWPIERRHATSDTNILDIFAGASHVLVLEELPGLYELHPPRYEVVSTDPNWPYYIDIEAENEEALAAQLADIPYTIVPESVWLPSASGANVRLYSLDGKYFVSGGEYSAEEDTYHPQSPDIAKSMIHPSSIIFDAQTEQVVAMVDKSGWRAKVLGWASDSSGVYLQFLPRGGDYGFAPAGFPTYKLLAPGQKPRDIKPIVVEGTPPNP